MSVICSECHGTKVSCEAMINPNTKEFIHYTDESFNYGWCGSCNKGQVLLDPEGTTASIGKAFGEYKSTHGKEPLYALCQIIYCGDDDLLERQFKLSLDVGDDDDEIFYYCNGIEELKQLAEPSSSDFIIITFNSFLE